MLTPPVTVQSQAWLMPLVMAMPPVMSWTWAVMEIRKAAAMDSWKEVGREMTAEKVGMAR